MRMMGSTKLCSVLTCSALSLSHSGKKDTSDKGDETEFAQSEMRRRQLNTDQRLKYARQSTDDGASRSPSLFSVSVPSQVLGRRAGSVNFEKLVRMSVTRFLPNRHARAVSAIRRKKEGKECGSVVGDGPFPLTARVPRFPLAILRIVGRPKKTRRHLHTTLQEFFIVCAEQKN